MSTASSKAKTTANFGTARQILEHLKHEGLLDGKRAVGCYLSMENGEVGTEGIVDELLRTGEFRFCFTALSVGSMGKGERRVTRTMLFVCDEGDDCRRDEAVDFTEGVQDARCNSRAVERRRTLTILRHCLRMLASSRTVGPTSHDAVIGRPGDMETRDLWSSRFGV